jgi:type I restriction enzyme S subunit
MRSNYKRLGDYIEPCNEKNTGNLIKELRGISNQKFFQKAKTNTIGIDLSKYRVVRTGQFAFNRATTRNGDKISIALREKEDCIVSPSYRMFKSKDENVLNSEYLMMWFRRPEFDRYARFKSHGSAHEFFDLDEMYEVELPIPSIEKQQEIVKEYNTIVKHINLNDLLNQKLEETAQALYKHWFVDFEFPNENGQPYKSSGGKMVYCDELDNDIPERWKTGTLELLGEIVGGATPSKAVPEYWTNENTAIAWISPKDLTKNNYKFIDKGDHFITETGYKKASTNLLPVNSVLFSSRAPIGILGINTNTLCTNQGFKSVIPHENVGCYYVYYFLKFNTNDIEDQGSGTTFNEVSGTVMKSYPAYLPSAFLLQEFSNSVKKIFQHQNNKESSTKALKQSKSLLLSKMSKVETLKPEKIL